MYSNDSLWDLMIWNIGARLEKKKLPSRIDANMIITLKASNARTEDIIERHQKTLTNFIEKNPLYYILSARRKSMFLTPLEKYSLN